MVSEYMVKLPSVSQTGNNKAEIEMITSVRWVALNGFFLSFFLYLSIVNNLYIVSNQIRIQRTTKRVNLGNNPHLQKKQQQKNTEENKSCVV